jgi:hypothetical protein
MHSRTKHFELDLYFVRDKVRSGEVIVVHLPAEFEVANILTKPISAIKFHEFRHKLMVTNLDTTSLRGGVRDKGQ